MIDWQSRGSGFESHQLHQRLTFSQPLNMGDPFSFPLSRLNIEPQTNAQAVLYGIHLAERAKLDTLSLIMEARDA